MLVRVKVCQGVWFKRWLCESVQILLVFNLFFIPVWGRWCARGCILRKHTSECMLVLSGMGSVCVLWTTVWHGCPGMLANCGWNWHVVVLWRCMLRKKHGETLQKSEHSEREKEHVRKTQKRLSYIEAFSLLWMEHKELMQQQILTAIWLLKNEKAYFFS